MFDFTSSKLLILGIVALLVIGPKDLPALLRTLGRYMGIIRRHANEFRAQFDEAMRETELADLKKEVEKVGQEAESTIRSAEQTVQAEIDSAKASVDSAMDDPVQPVADAGGTGGTDAGLNGSTHADATTGGAGAGQATEKSGA